jgi:hypothetical protein
VRAADHDHDDTAREQHDLVEHHEHHEHDEHDDDDDAVVDHDDDARGAQHQG